MRRATRMCCRKRNRSLSPLTEDRRTGDPMVTTVGTVGWVVAHARVWGLESHVLRAVSPFRVRKPWGALHDLCFGSEGSAMSAFVMGTGSHWSAECYGCDPPFESGVVTTRESAQKAADAHNRQKHSAAPARPAVRATSATAAAPAASSGARPCHICGSTAIRWKKTNKLAKTLFLTPALLMKKKPHCANCGAVRQA